MYVCMYVRMYVCMYVSYMKNIHTHEFKNHVFLDVFIELHMPKLEDTLVPSNMCMYLVIDACDQWTVSRRLIQENSFPRFVVNYAVVRFVRGT